MQSSALLDPSVNVVDPGHIVQDQLSRPRTSLYSPIGHAVQELAPPTLSYLPFSQREQEEFPGKAYLPAMQGMQYELKPI
jgi:hypothetical protein